MANLYRAVAANPVTKGAPTAMTRMARLHLSSRIGWGRVVVPFIDETRLIVGAGMAGATGNVYLGLHEFEDMSFVLHFLRPGDTFFDVGANVGVYTVLASGVRGVRTHAFEPIAESLSSLSDNVALNGLGALVATHPVAVGDANGTIAMTSSHGPMNHVADSTESGAMESAELVRLDEFIEDCPTLLKMDVEGHEGPALEGARELITDERLRAIVVEVNFNAARRGLDPQRAHELLRSAGFESFRYGPLTRTLTSLLPSEIEPGNVIYIRDIDDARKRVETATSFCVNDQWV